MEYEIAERDTLETMVRVYNEGISKIIAAYTLIDEAKNSVSKTFQSTGFYGFPDNSYFNLEYDIEKIKKAWKQQAWNTIINRCNIKKILSIKRRNELDNQINSAYKDELPEITIENILALIQDSMANSQNYANEAIYEIFEWLRFYHSGYKRNEKWKIGPKVILTCCVTFVGSKNYKWSTNHHNEKKLMALDNIFHMLDGKGTIKGYSGPLVDGIKTTETGLGETDYFTFKCYRNSNIHLTSKRQDLVDKINHIAGNNNQLGYK